MTQFIIFSGRSALLELTLGKSRKIPGFEVQETAQVGFEVDDYDEQASYQILIGDIPLTHEPLARRARLEWPASRCLDGASGITPISLRDARTGVVLARSLALVEPSKLSASAYETMFDDMRRISVELLLDLVSKSRLALLQGTPPRHSGVQPLTARLELAQIRRFWTQFSSILAGILEEPHAELRTCSKIRRPRSGERLNSGLLRRLAQQGRGPREAVRSGRLLELPTAISDRNTLENRVLVAFIALLHRRMERSLRRAKAECDMRVDKLRSYGPADAALKRFVERREVPRIAKLREIVEASEEVLTEMHRAIRSLAVPVERMMQQDLLTSFESPIFRSHPHYARAAQLMRGFLNTTSIVVEQGDAEGAKPIETIFEQWVFFQISAALQAAGLSCISHNSIFEPIARDRFSGRSGSERCDRFRGA